MVGLRVEEYVRARIESGPQQLENKITFRGKRLPFRTPYASVYNHLKGYLSGKRVKNVILLPGLRGTGKTTMLFQAYDYIVNRWGVSPTRVLYASMDEAFGYYEIDVLKLGRAFLRRKNRPAVLLLDEVHYDPRWALELKILADQEADALIIATGSSALLLKLGADLARRAKVIDVPPLSFSEYLMLRARFEGQEWYPPRGLRQLLRRALEGEVGVQALQTLQRQVEESALSAFGQGIVRLFWAYVESGGFPFTFMNASPSETYEEIRQIVRKIVEADLPHIGNFEVESLIHAKRLLTFLALAPPGPVSENRLAEKLGISRKLVGALLDSLSASGLLFSLRSWGGAGKSERKPRKYYFAHPSIVQALAVPAGARRRRSMRGKLLETAVAAALHRLTGQDYALEYVYGEGPDFILTSPNGSTTAVEVGAGKSTARQLRRANVVVRILATMRRGVVERDGVLAIPAWLLCML